MTLLLVDDDETFLRSLRRQLVRYAEVLTATDADEAIRVLEEFGVAAILTDHQMPGRTGVELLEEARRRWPATRRVLTSGAGLRNIDSLIESGIVDASSRFVFGSNELGGIS